MTIEAAQKSYEEIVDLFAQATTPTKILAFRPSRTTHAKHRERFTSIYNFIDHWSG